MTDENRPDDARSPLRLMLRIYPDSGDPRHERIMDWYHTLPTSPGGRKMALQDRLVELLAKGLELTEKPMAAPQDSSKKGSEGRRKATKSRQPAPKEGKTRVEGQETADEPPEEVQAAFKRMSF